MVNVSHGRVNTLIFADKDYVFKLSRQTIICLVVHLFTCKINQVKIIKSWFNVEKELSGRSMFGPITFKIQEGVHVYYKQVFSMFEH